MDTLKLQKANKLSASFCDMLSRHGYSVESIEHFEKKIRVNNRIIDSAKTRFPNNRFLTK